VAAVHGGEGQVLAGQGSGVQGWKWERVRW
jgi:hypothetical protein